MTRMAMEMANMLRYLEESPTSFRGWRDYFEDKALRLANWDPAEYSQLPMTLSAELRRLESKHSPPQQRKRGTR